MRIGWGKVLRAGKQNQVLIRYKCAIGNSMAKWPDQSVEPVVDADFFVEYTFPETIRIGRNASVLQGVCHPSVGVDDDSFVVIDGLLEGVDEDGVAGFRLAPDCITLINAEAGEQKEGMWLRLRFPVLLVKLWPIRGGY